MPQQIFPESTVCARLCRNKPQVTFPQYFTFIDAEPALIVVVFWLGWTRNTARNAANAF